MFGAAMPWMRMPGQSWFGAAASFLGMWTAMMVPMMLPSVAPALWRYRQSVGRGRRGFETSRVALGYFLVWALFGVVIFPVGVALGSVMANTSLLMRLTPVAVGLVVLVAGGYQLTSQKARDLACWHHMLQEAGVTGGVRFGLQLGFRCARCCANLMAILLAIGVMDIRAMIVVGIAITAERVLPRGEWIAKAIGVAAVGVGAVLIARAARIA